MKKFLTAITAAFVTAMGISSVPALSAGTPMDFTGDERVDVYDLICARKSGIEAEKLNLMADFLLGVGDGYKDEEIGDIPNDFTIDESCILEPKGTIHTGDGTYYGGGYVGGCAMLDPVSTDYWIVAMNLADYNDAQLAGAYLEVTGELGTINMLVTDLLPEGKKGDLDLYVDAFPLIAPQEKGRVAKELTTPTGAALAKVLGETALELPANFICEKIAYGAGTWELEIPNVLRVHVGTVADEKNSVILEVACNIDDMSGEVFAYVIERLLLAGALDAWAEPIVMKKGRPAYKLVFLVAESKLHSLLDVVFEETTTLGVRYHQVERTVLERRSAVVATPYGSVAVKYGLCNGAVVNIAPEFESCKEIAASAKVSLKKAMQYAQIAAEELLNE